jgi:hypothetical protein
MSDTPPPPPPSFGDSPFGTPTYGSPPPPPSTPDYSPPDYSPPDYSAPPQFPAAPAYQQPSYPSYPSYPGAAPGQGMPPGGAGMPPLAPYPGGPYGGQVSGGSPTKGMAIAALVLGIVGLFSFFIFIAAVLAIIFGIIASRRVKRSPGQFTGRGMAITGLVLGIIGVLGGIAFWIAVGVAAKNKTDLNDVTAGDCVEVPSGTIFFGITKQSCDKPHQGEVFSAKQFDTPGAYPGDTAARNQVGQACADDFQGYVGVTPANSDLDIFVIFPSKTKWEDSDSTQIVCIAKNSDGSLLTDTIKGSNH